MHQNKMWKTKTYREQSLRNRRAYSPSGLARSRQWLLSMFEARAEDEMFGVSRQIRQMGVEALTKPWLSHRNDVLLRRTKVQGTILRGGHQRPRKWPHWVKDLKVQFLCTCLQNAFSSLALMVLCVKSSQAVFVSLFTSKTSLVTTKCFVLVVSLSKPGVFNLFQPKDPLAERDTEQGPPPPPPQI